MLQLMQNPSFLSSVTVVCQENIENCISKILVVRKDLSQQLEPLVYFLTLNLDEIVAKDLDINVFRYSRIRQLNI